METNKTHILIIGAGQGGTALVELFHESPTVEISGIVDIDPEASGMKLAAELGIPASLDYHSLLERSRIDEVINVTGSEQLQRELVKAVPDGVEVIGGHSAELMWRLVEERKRYESALKESEKGYRTLVEGANQPIFKLDKEGKIVFVNTYSAGMFGGKADDFTGKTVWEVFPHYVARTLMKGVNSAVLRQQRVLEHIAPPKDGEQRWYDVIVQPLADETCNIEAVLVIGMDVTETKKTERNLFVLNHTLLALGQDFSQNLKMIARACGTIMESDCVFYNRNSEGSLSTLGAWIRPGTEDFTGKLKGHICSEVINRAEKGKPFIVKDLQSSEYAKKDPQIVKYGLKTYVGCPVCRYGECVGTLCVMYTRDMSLDETEIKMLGILADALSREEDRESAIMALRESERDYRMLFDNAADLIAIVDAKGNFLDLNRKFEEESGYSKEEMLGRNLATSGILTGVTSMRAMKYLVSILSGRDIPIFEVDGVRKDGGIINYEVRAVPVRKDDKVVAVQAILRNVSDRKRAEAEVREAKDYLDKIINSVADPIFVKDTDHKWILLNDAYCDFMGHKRDELIGRSEYEFFPSEEADVFWEKDDQVFKTAEENINEEKFTDARGNTHTIITKKTLYVDNRGERMLVGIIRDITERKKSEEELQRQRELLNNIISTAPYYVFWKNVESVYLGCNDNYAKLAGLKDAREILGKTERSLGRNEQEAVISERYDSEVMRNNTPMLNVEEERAGPDGKKITFLTSRVPLCDPEGRVTGVLGMYADISGRKEMEEALRSSEIMYRTIFENTGSSMMLLESDLTLSKVNAEFSRMIGYSVEDIEGKRKVLDFIPEDETGRILEYNRLRKMDPEAAPRNYETKLLRSDGELLDVYVTVALIPNSKRSVASLLDITELKRNETELRRQKELLDNVNRALEHKVGELEKAMGHIKKLEGLVPICAHCKKMRVEGGDPRDEGSWVVLEKYITDRTDASFTHGLCPECMRKLYGDLGKKK